MPELNDVEEQEDAPEEEEDGEPPDLDSRILCSDGACIGIIGPDGKCKECGKEMDPDDAPLLEAAQAKADAEGGQADDDDDDEWEEEEEDDDEPPALDDRELCPDGNCIGIIGPDDNCKECGRHKDSDPDDDEPEEEEPEEEEPEEEEPPAAG